MAKLCSYPTHLQRAKWEEQTRSFTLVKETEEIKTKRASFSPHPAGRAGAELGAQAAVPNQHQGPVSSGPASSAAPAETRQHLHPCPPGTAGASVPEHAPAGPAPLSPPPLSAHSPARAWTCLPRPPQLRHAPLPHTRRPPPSPRGRATGPGDPQAEDCARSRSSPLDGEGGTQPASLSYSSGPSAILVLNPLLPLHAGRKRFTLAGLRRGGGRARGEREPRRRRRGRRRLLPLPVPPPLPPPLGPRGALRARARVSGPARAGRNSAALRRGRRARALGVGAAARAGPGLPQPCASGCRGIRPPSEGNPVLHVGNLAAAQPEGRAQAVQPGLRGPGRRDSPRQQIPLPRSETPGARPQRPGVQPSPRSAY